jgi:agmatinase
LLARGNVEGYTDLLLEPRLPTFIGLPRDAKAARAVLVGVPHDSSSTCKPGCRFAPRRVREVSQNLETYDPQVGVDASELPASDVGDIREALSPAKVVEDVAKVVRELSTAGKIPFVVGGDHMVTLGALKGLTERVSLIMFDAHLDYRDEFPQGEKLSHATVLRRAREGPVKEAVVVGARAVSKEEITALERDGQIRLVYPWSMNRLKDELSTISGRVYVTVDMDVLDPSVAPGVGCPEPGGLTFSELAGILTEVVDSRVVGFDVVEANPLVDVNDITSCAVAKLLMKALLLLLAR